LTGRGASPYCAGAFICVLNQRSSDAAEHVSRFDEQPVEFVAAPVARDDDRKADRRSIVVKRDADPPVVDEVLRQLDRIGIRAELLAVGNPYI
jgi:hypothetical protein